VNGSGTRSGTSAEEGREADVQPYASNQGSLRSGATSRIPRGTTDPHFRRAVEGLRVPQMGTEVVAPLLAHLIQFLRPRSVLEIGMGYTTPFLAAALAQVRLQVSQESLDLAEKTRPYLAGGKALDEAWLHAEPPLLTPEFYLEPYEPRLVALDNLSIADSSAARVLEVLGELELTDLVTVVNADLHDAVELLPDGFAPIDLAWVDAWECLYFFDEFWDLIQPDGGVVIMHYLMTYPEGEAILQYFRQFERANPGELEIVNLLEPHKLIQNSLTMLRRTAGSRRPGYARPGGRLIYDDPLRAQARTHTDLVVERSQCRG
jgi:predicted O-methyltransferase YrrM